MQVSTLVYCMGNQAEEIFASFKWEADDDKKDPDKVIAQFDKYFVPRRNVIFERAKFGSREQYIDEPIETYVRALYQLAEHCNFGATKDDFIRDRLVLGLRDKALSEQLQMEEELTLSLAVDKCRHKEMIQLQNKSDSTKMVAAVQQKDKRQQNNKYRKDNQNQESKNKICDKCGFEKRRSHARGSCPAKQQRCRKCNRIGHFERACRQKIHYVEDNRVERRFHDRDDRDEDIRNDMEKVFLGAVDVQKQDGYEPPWKVNILVNGSRVNFKIDSGADVNVMSKKQYLSLNPLPELKQNRAKLDGVGGQLKNLGYFQTEVEYRNQKYCVDMFVVDHDSPSLMSRSLACEMNLIKRVDDVTSSIGLMQCDPVKIHVKRDAIPYSVSTPRRIPLPMMAKVENELNRMENEGVIIKQTEPTEWCSPIVPVLKPNGQVRLCVDLKKLNMAIERERYVIPTLQDIFHNMNGSAVFTSLDAASGYWQMPLDENSSKLTTFITPFGRYRFTRVPFGISIASEIYQREMSRILRGLDGIEVYQDDIIIHGKDARQHDERLRKTLDVINMNGIKLNQKKCKYRQSSITFLGHRIDANGIFAHEDKIKAIVDMTAPTNVPELRSFMGMVNFMARFIPSLSTIMEPLSRLLKSDQEWTWDAQQEDAFAAVKNAMTKSTALAFYDHNRPTKLSSDASSYGLGAVILQEIDGEFRPVEYASRTLTNAERHYAQIEKELLGVVWACERFSRYLVGLDKFIIETDHKPLIPIINVKDLDGTPIRCQRLLIRLMRYNGVAQFSPGKTLVLADLLSRKPLEFDNDKDLENDVQFYVHAITSGIPASKEKIQIIQEESEKDSVICRAIKLTLEGWPNVHKVPPGLREMYHVRGSLSSADGLLMYNNRVVIPENMRAEMLARIHEGHMGVTKSRLWAQDAIWWPGISNDIKTYVEKCHHCQVNRPAQKAEPLRPKPLPERPWQDICMDILEYGGRHYLAVIDEYSRWLEIVHMKNMSSSVVVLELKNLFARWGIPHKITSDNGSQFTSVEFHKFANDYGFKTVTTSPYHPQGNGRAENGVKLAKHILKQNDVFKALMVYRATPSTVTGFSPCQLLQGRRMATTLPMMTSQLMPNRPNHDMVRQRDESAKEKQAFYFDRRHGVKEMSKLQPGDTVRLKAPLEKQWGKPSVVVKPYEGNEARSYVVDTGNGEYRRNRRHIQIIPKCEIPPPDPIMVPNSGQTLIEPTEPSVNQPPEPAVVPVVNDNQNRTVQRPIRSTRGKVPERYRDFVSK